MDFPCVYSIFLRRLINQSKAIPCSHAENLLFDSKNLFLWKIYHIHAYLPYLLWVPFSAAYIHIHIMYSFSTADHNNNCYLNADGARRGGWEIKRNERVKKASDEICIIINSFYGRFSQLAAHKLLSSARSSGNAPRGCLLNLFIITSDEYSVYIMYIYLVRHRRMKLALFTYYILVYYNEYWQLPLYQPAGVHAFTWTYFR